MSQHKQNEVTSPKTSHAVRAESSAEQVAQLQWQRTQLTRALGELYQLLEEYGPAWYSHELHDRVRLALQLVTESAECGGIPSNNDHVARIGGSEFLF